ncbi:MAG: ATP-binding cassette domain-containing protein [Acidilobaceae archaeon]
MRVCVGGSEIVKGVDLRVGRGEVHVVLGPNGAGKSTLLAAIMGLPRVSLCGGSIVLEGEDVSSLPPSERASRGIALAHQFTPVIKGVRASDVAKALIERYGCSDYTLLSKMLRVDELLERYLFHGLSGGERKRLELYLTMLQKPKVALLDEPDSGIDVDSLKLIAEALNYMVDRKETSVLLVTHSGAIIERLSKVSQVHVMMSGRIVYSGGRDVASLILSEGYTEGLRKLGVAL